MSRLIRICLVGVALVAAGCGSNSKELPPVKDTKLEDKEKMEKMKQESMQRNNAGGRSNLQIPTDQNKTP
ncbi:MAG: hypothetical protein HY290_30370 [Planctomycetia bacterium]|nr:hypothetical protein [Planctomycetia bacterium]